MKQFFSYLHADHRSKEAINFSRAARAQAMKLFHQRAKTFPDTHSGTLTEQRDNSTNVYNVRKDSTPPKTPEDGISLLVPREISFDYGPSWSGKKRKQKKEVENHIKKTTTLENDIPTQTADDMPTQSAEDTQQSIGGGGGDGETMWDKVSGNVGAAVVAGAGAEEGAGGRLENDEHDEGDPPPPPRNRYGDDDSDIVGPDYCPFCDEEPCVWVRCGDDILEFDRINHIEVADEDRPAPNDCRKSLYRQVIGMIWGSLGSGNRRKVPRCVLTEIQGLHPSLNGNYMGHHDA
jgi:hypothetical protein